MLTGIIYTARDAAHKRLLEEYGKTGQMPFDIKNATIYYAGPSPAKPGEVSGAIGPTTSGRMDAYAPQLMDMGLTGMIGKGLRNAEVKEAIKRNGAVYFAATGGAGALLANAVKSMKIVAYEDLGAEAIRELYVEDFPAIVVMDSYGGNLYETERQKYSKI
ncbi:Fumarate hydratase class I, aerobic [bioreactor metagenome]|uniref:Fumarate hydratase class I, aerobic n=1 Tax=bioreactor metagenome TaxID=1076179 RepID=A0A645I5N0_9ZZZZ